MSTSSRWLLAKAETQPDDYPSATEQRERKPEDTTKTKRRPNGRTRRRYYGNQDESDVFTQQAQPDKTTANAYVSATEWLGREPEDKIEAKKKGRPGSRARARHHRAIKRQNELAKLQEKSTGRANNDKKNLTKVTAATTQVNS